MNERIYNVNGKEYTILRLLGKGKGGYSYLAQTGEKYVVVKQIHHEPCSYYQFGNKIEAEVSDYKRLNPNSALCTQLNTTNHYHDRVYV